MRAKGPPGARDRDAIPAAMKANRHSPRVGAAVAISTMAAIVLLTLVPASQQPSSTSWCLVCGTLGGVDILLNLVLFVPLGFGLAIAGVRVPIALIGMCLFSLGI